MPVTPRRHVCPFLLALPSLASAADEVDWGFRENFRRYVYSGTGQPPISAGAGATCDPNPDTVRGGCDPKLRLQPSDPPPPHALRWLATDAYYTLPSGDGFVTAQGTVVFDRPDHFFKLTLQGPKVTIAGGDVTVNARIKIESSYPPVPSSDERVDVGTFQLTGPPQVAGGFVTWQTGPGQVTQEAADSTSGFLAAGAELDPVTIVLPESFPPPSPYPRPKGASPLRASLVPGYQPCTTPNRTHGAPLSSGSCTPPALTSSHLTLGTPDANGKVARSVGSAQLNAVVGNPTTPADEADLRFAIAISDVRRSGNLADYTGQLQVNVPMRITDRDNGPGQTGTVADSSFKVTVPCTATADPDSGSTCSIVTTADSVAPGAIKEGKRAIWQLGQIKVDDGGPDGVASTQDNSPFLVQGVFVP